MSELLTKDEAVYFRDQLRDARLRAQQDAEAFEGIVFILERLGCFLRKEQGGLGKYKCHVIELASRSPLFGEVPDAWRQMHIPFSQLYEFVRNARNNGMHGGAAARYATAHAIELALVLEDALMNGCDRISDFMVKSVVCAEMWQPLSFIRQQMLANSFSALPVMVQSGRTPGWRLISDKSVVQYLRLRPNGLALKQLLVQSLQEAANEDNGLALAPARQLDASAAAAEGLESWDGQPVLVTRGETQELLGIVTPYDLL